MSGTKPEKLKIFREKDKVFLISLLTPLVLSDETAVEDLLRTDTEKWVTLDPVGGIVPTQVMLRCLQQHRHMTTEIMLVCCALLQRRDNVICQFYYDVNHSSLHFQPRLTSRYLVHYEGCPSLAQQLPYRSPLHRIYVVHHRRASMLNSIRDLLLTL